MNWLPVAILSQAEFLNFCYANSVSPHHHQHLQQAPTYKPAQHQQEKEGDKQKVKGVTPFDSCSFPSARLPLSA